MAQNNFYSPDTAIHPGISLRDELDFSGISQKDLSARIGVSTKHISQIINGVEPITPETALKLERVLRTPASFWNNLQKNYELVVAQIEEKNRLEHEIEEAKKFTCYNELVDLRFVEKTSDWKEKANNLLNFFGISSLSYVGETQAVAFRQSAGEFNLYSLASWLRCAEIEYATMDLPDYDKSTLRKLIPEFRELTKQPEGFGTKLQELCASAGVALIYTPYFRNTKVNGSARWIGNNPVIQLNTRGVYGDIFWFTFFHEIGHILLHGIKDKFVDYQGQKVDEKEKEANEFASDALIPKNEYKDFISHSRLNRDTVNQFATKIGIDAGIVLGRLAFEKKAHWGQIAGDRKRLQITS